MSDHEVCEVDEAEEEEAAQLAGYADALADAVEAVLAGWVERSVADRSAGVAGLPADVADRARAAGADAVAAMLPPLRELLAADVDEQRSSPLAVLRRAVRFPTAVLRDVGAPAVVRDPFARRTFPDDDYDLTPASFADLDPSLAGPGIAWGAAKAHVILRRRRAEGRR